MKEKGGDKRRWWDCGDICLNACVQSMCDVCVCVCVCVCVMFVLSGGCYDECDEGKLVREPLHGTNNASKR